MDSSRYVIFAQDTFVSIIQIYPDKEIYNKAIDL